VFPKWSWLGSREQFLHCRLRKFRHSKSSVRFRLTQRIARSLGDSWASCYVSVIVLLSYLGLCPHFITVFTVVGRWFACGWDYDRFNAYCSWDKPDYRLLFFTDVWLVSNICSSSVGSTLARSSAHTVAGSSAVGTIWKPFERQWRSYS